MWLFSFYSRTQGDGSVHLQDWKAELTRFTSIFSYSSGQVDATSVPAFNTEPYKGQLMGIDDEVNSTGSIWEALHKTATDKGERGCHMSLTAVGKD